MSSPSDFLTSYRAQFPDDPRTDAELAGIFGLDPTPRPTNPETAVAATAPKGGFGTSLRAGIESGTYGLGETLANVGALAADWVPGTVADPLRNKMLQAGQEYAQQASTAAARAPVQELEQIQGAGDFVNWAGYGIGQLAPSVAEAASVSIAAGLAGAGATAETGPGAALGGIGGAALGFIERKAVKRLIAAGVKDLASEAGKKLLATEMKNVAGSVAASAAGGINSWALSSGEIYGNLLKNANVSPEDARNYATGMGAVAAIPDTILPGYLWGRFFDKPIKEVSKKEATAAGNFLLRYMLNTGEEAAKVGAIEGSTEAFQEWVNVAAEHWADPESAAGGFDISPEEWSRIKNAGAVGALGGVVGAPAVGYGATRQEFAPRTFENAKPATAQEMFEAAAMATPRTAPVPEFNAPEKIPEIPSVSQMAAEGEITAPEIPVSVAPVPEVIPEAEAAVVPEAPAVSTPEPVTEPAQAMPVATVPEAPQIAGLDEWHPMETQPSIGQLKAYGTEVGVSQNEKTGKPALSRMSVVTQNPDGSISVNGIYAVPNSKEGVRVHEGGTTGRAVTNKDIAEVLGLSVSTVTSANKASSTVSQATRDLVKQTRIKLMESRVQNRGIEKFVEGKQVLGFLKTTEASEDFRRTFADKAEFDKALSGLQEGQIKRQEVKKRVVERKQLGLLANDIVGSLEKSGPEGATAAAILNAAADEIAGRTMVSKREALHALFSRETWDEPGELTHPAQVFVRQGAKALGLFGPKELMSMLGLSPEAAVSKLRAAILAKQIGIPVDTAEAFLTGTLTDKVELAKIEEMVRKDTGENIQRWADAYAKRGEARVGNKGTIQYDEAKKAQTKVDDYEGTTKTVESPEVNFVSPSIPDELDGAPVGSPAAVRTNPTELMVAKGIFTRLEGQTINQKNEVEVVEFLAKFQKALQGVAARKESVQLGIFKDGRLNDMEYVAGLAQEAARSERYTGQLPSIHRVSDAFIRKAFNRVVQYAGNMGMDIRLVQGVVDSASELIANEQAKIVTDKNTGRTVITVALNDIAAPTRDNLKALMHEVAHAVVRTLPGWQQRATHDAIWSAFEKGDLRRASNDPRLHNWETAERAGLSKSEFLEELLVEHMTALGMERAQSKTLIQEILQMVRRAFAIAGKTLAAAKGYVFGNDSSIIEFAENEFASVIDKALAPRINLLEWVGLARRSPSEKAVYFNLSTEGVFAQSYDPSTGELSAQNMILDSAAAVSANVEQIMDQLFYRSNAEVLTLDSDALKYELGLMEKPPGQMDIPDTYMVTVMNYGDGIPVAVQMDVVENGVNTWSGNMDAVRELGYFVPDFSSLPTGQYTAKEAVAKVLGLTESRTAQSFDLRDPKFIAELANVKEVRNPEGKLLAPNGEVSKLTEYQWKQVRTPSFKAWFGDWENDPKNASKVVDPETGEPMVMYHGTREGDIETFDINRTSPDSLFGQGFYFTNDPAVSSEYVRKPQLGSRSHHYANPQRLKEYLTPGRVLQNGDTVISFDADENNPTVFVQRWPRPVGYRPNFTNAEVDAVIGKRPDTSNPNVTPVFLNIRNAIDADNKSMLIGSDFTVGDLIEEGEQKILTDYAGSYGSPDSPYGFDGVTHVGGVRRGDIKHRVFIATSPAQIKSASGNTGAFSPANADIRYTKQIKSKLQQPFRVTQTTDTGTEEFVSEHSTLAEARKAAAKIPNGHVELDSYITAGADPSPALLTQLNVVAQGVADIVDRLTHGQARLHFVKDLDLPSDYAKDGNRQVNGMSVNDIIAINTTAMAINSANGDIFRSLSTASHESWHFLQDQGFVTKEEMSLLRKSLPQLREFLAKTYGDVTDWNALNEDEVFAFSFGEYAKLVMTGHPGDFPNITATSVMDKVYQFFKKVATLLKSLGYSDVQDFTVKNIFYKAWSGEIGTRIPTKSREILYAKRDELRTEQKPVFDARVKFGMETLSATLNSLEARLGEIFTPLLKGASLESYLDKVLKVGSGAVPIVKMRERLEADAKLHGADGQFNSTLSLDGKGENEITNPVLLDQVQRETYRNLEKLGEKVRKTHNSEVRNIEKDLRINSRKKEKWLSALGNFNNAEVLLAPIVADIKRLVKNLNTDLVTGVARKPVTEAMRELLGYDVSDRQVTAEFIPALKTAGEWISSGTNLLDAVTEISKLGLDYEGSPSTNRDKIKASGVPLLQDLTDGTPVATAKLTLLLTAAKNEPGMFGLARLRVEKDSKIKFELGKLLSDALAGDNARWTVLLNSARASIGEAKYSREMLKALNLDRRRLIAEYESLVKRKADLPAYEVAEKAIADGLSKLQAEAGYFLADTPLIEGSEVFHIKNPGATREEVLSENSKTKISLIGEEAAVYVTKIWLDNGLWLKAYTGPKDAVYHRVREQTDKLGKMMTARTQTEGKKWWGSQFIQSISDRLIDTGSPLGRDAARMLTRYADRLWSNVDRVRVLGDNVDRKYGEVAKVFKLFGNSAEIHSLFFDPGYAFIEAHPEITDKNQLYVELKAHLMNGSKVAEKLLRENPTGFQKVTELLEANTASFEALRKLADSWGVLVEDSGMQIFNPITGESESVMRYGRKVALQMAPRNTRKACGLYAKMESLWAGERTFGMSYIEDRYLGNDVMKNKSFQASLDKKDVEAKKKMIESLNLFMSERPSGREGVISGLREYFDPTVIADFVLPLVRKGEVFSGVNKGYARDANVLAAWNNSGNDVVVFAENLFDLEYVKREGTADDDVLKARAKFVADTVGTFKGYFKDLKELAGTSSKNRAFLGQESSHHSLMDSRKATLLPSEWTEYALGTPELLRVVLEDLVIHSTLGRDMEDFTKTVDTVNKQITAAVDTLHKRRLVIRRAAELAGEILSAKQVEKRLQMSFVDQSEYRTLLALAKNQDNVGKVNGEIIAWRHTQTNPDTDLKVPLGVVQAIARLMVNTWRTFLYNANALFSMFMRYKLSRTAVSQFLNTLKYTGDQVAGTLLSAFGKQLSETAAEKQLREDVGMFIDPEVYTDMYGRWASPGAGGNYEKDSTGRTVARMRKTVDTITNFGWGGNARYAKLRPFGALNMGSIMFKRALMRGQLRTVVNFISKAVAYLEQHPEAAGDPSFRFSADILGYKDRMGLDERGAYEALTDSLSKSGYPLELIAREAYAKKRQKGYNGSLLTTEQSQAVMARALDELSLEPSLGNVPIWTRSSGAARAAMPLLTWPVIQTNTVLKSFLNEDGKASLRSARYGIKAMLLAIVPMSLAYTLLMDEWDEEVLGRKGNLAPLSLDQGFGAFAGASVERLARMGTFGLAGDLVNGYRVYGTDGDLRGLSFDQRVLFMNSFLTLNRTISTLVQQGPGNLTYETFYRPLASSLGAGQAIQYMQLINNYGDDLLGVKPFTAEAEALKRLNVRYFLSAGGRLTGLEVRGRSSGGGTTNSVRPWITRMGVAAMSDDAREFQEAYRNAVREAREMGEEAPEEYVKRQFSSGHPLRSTFKTPPTEAEINRLLGTLNGYGRETVRSAVQQYDRYGESLGIKPYTGRQEKSVKSTINPLDVKRRAKQALFQ